LIIAVYAGDPLPPTDAPLNFRVPESLYKTPVVDAGAVPENLIPSMLCDQFSLSRPIFVAASAQLHKSRAKANMRISFFMKITS
jgi:hypothetical protein